MQSTKHNQQRIDVARATAVKALGEASGVEYQRMVLERLSEGIQLNAEKKEEAAHIAHSMLMQLMIGRMVRPEAQRDDGDCVFRSMLTNEKEYWGDQEGSLRKAGLEAREVVAYFVECRDAPNKNAEEVKN